MDYLFIAGLSIIGHKNDVKCHEKAVSELEAKVTLQQSINFVYMVLVLLLKEFS